jgi:RNA polymerase sigma factor (sigma-70 family)
MTEDADLLRRYLDEKSEDAFTELVRRHLGHVYATALRRVGGDAQLAEDVAQQVFTALARKAPRLRGRSSLGGWLYLSAQHASAAVVRRERRRKRREAFAPTMEPETPPSAAAPDSERLRRVLDDALLTLKPEDREALVQRFFQQRTFAEVGASLRVTEEAARKRVDRALEKLRLLLARRGVSSSAAGLAAGLAATVGALRLSPALGAHVARQALAQAAVQGPFLATALVGLKTLWPVGAALALGLTAVVVQQRHNRALRADLAALPDATAQIAAWRAENRRLSAAVAAAEARRAAQRRAVPNALAPTSASAPAPAATPSDGASITASVMTAITLRPDGTLTWGEDPVSLAEFLRRLRHEKEANAGRDAVLIVNAPSAEFPALAYVIDEARKANLPRFFALSDARPEQDKRIPWF